MCLLYASYALYSPKAKLFGRILQKISKVLNTDIGKGGILKYGRHFIKSAFYTFFIRLYLINSPVVRAETLKFQEKGVKDVVKDVFLPWYNAYRFLSQSIDQFQRVHNVNFAYDENNTMELHNIMDKWILSFTQSLVQFVHQEMDAYRLYTVVPRLVKFIEYLTNWYVRFNRKRLKGDQGQEDAMQAIQTLFGVVLTITKLMLAYSFDQNGDLPSTYEPHSDSEILILLDVTPDQKMLDEGLAREFVNRIQKLYNRTYMIPGHQAKYRRGGAVIQWV
ncbi:predicted protein [Nematostella vectensis]|uniref:Methionyl/Valyl/Leucyl/Isoleucyl-tRNA synthetase anticodon-binding domain-containing protein n=1 Tax=Nematostella vectensis TaxID=45351 RepID=A7T7R5_NEMVE|nr:predicted protein [Nematostella vectensis]|eukprot:XP_001620084.1 hypothetical protein NEMVEDRAFT_v1g223489 [Nematostella vectensis]